MNVLLIDMGSLAYPIWAMSGKEADPDHTSNTVVGRVHGLASGYDAVAICCDSPKSWRKEAVPSYKATRPAKEEPYIYQLRAAQERLAADGFPVWQVDGYEADDVIASACKLLGPEREVVIASADKDLLALVRPGVTVLSLRTGDRYDAARVEEKLGVAPEQVVDFLCLVGDKSDNVAGVPGVGDVRAAELLLQFGSIQSLLRRMENDADEEVAKVRPATLKAISESLPALETARKLVTLVDSLPIPIEQLKPREQMEEPVSETKVDEDGVVHEDHAPAVRNVTAMARRPVVPVAPTALVKPTEWSMALEPQDGGMAYELSTVLFQSRLFSQYGNQQAVLAVIMAGRSLGLDSMTALRGIYLVEGKVALSGQLMVALVLRSKLAKTFSLVKSTDQEAIWKTQRIGDDPIEMGFSLEDAKRAGLAGKKVWQNYGRQMLRWRAAADLARAVYPDVLQNCYLPDELGREELLSA